MPPEDRRYVPSQTVTPRDPQCNANRPIVVVIDDSYCTEDGVTGSTSSLVEDLRHMPLTTVVTATESAAFLKLTQDRWGKYENFNFRVMPVEREIFTGRSHGRKLSLSLTSVSWFGWSKEKCGRSNSVRNRYHLLTDPLTFSGGWLPDRSFMAYLKWGQDIREFCIAQGWNLAPTQGGVARQSLRDPRFYPRARRKVPRSTNERVRAQLPGNHYQLGVDADPEKEYDGEYLDQSRCHHYHAIAAKLPNSDDLHGFGHFRDPESTTRAYRRTPERVASFLDGFAGMCYGTLFWSVRHRKRSPLLPKYLQSYGTLSQPTTQPVYFYSEDLPLLDSLNVKVTGIIAAWGSKKLDTGLARYAQFALDELSGSAPSWKKSLLLSPYGSLATTPHKQTVAYHRSKKGKPEVLVTRNGTRLPVSMHVASKVSEPQTNNVLHRALIEAANRTETLMFSQYIESIGHKVLCIYVDGVIVERDDDLGTAPLFHPWRMDKKLTRLRFLSESQFVSNELEKLPGITGADLRRRVLMGGMGAPRSAYLGTAADMALRRYDAWVSAA